MGGAPRKSWRCRRRLGDRLDSKWGGIGGDEDEVAGEVSGIAGVGVEAAESEEGLLRRWVRGGDG